MRARNSIQERGFGGDGKEKPRFCGVFVEYRYNDSLLVARRVPATEDRTRYRSHMAASVDFTISFDNPDEEGWIVARVLEVPGAMSQGRTREEARENALDALRTVLTPDEELAGQAPKSDREHLRFTAAA